MNQTSLLDNPDFSKAVEKAKWGHILIENVRLREDLMNEKKEKYGYKGKMQQVLNRENQIAK